MNIRLFPDRFLKEDACFHLFRPGTDGALELPVTIEGKSGVPVHIVHSDPDNLAYLAALLVLQSWLYGIDELELPPKRRRPLLVVTETPRRFAEVYLQLHIPAESIRQVSRRRNQLRYKECNIVPNLTTDPKSEFWDRHVKSGETRTRLHNFFPAYLLLHQNGSIHQIASRQQIGRGDISTPALLIVRATKRTNLTDLRDRFGPFLIILDTHGLAVPDGEEETPSLIYHNSIFSPDLANATDGLVLCCLPDARFERFCSEASLRLVEPQESAELAAACSEVDGALQALNERIDERRHHVLAEVHRVASRLRNVLFSLPVGIETYEQALVASGQSDSLEYDWSVTEPLNSLENRLPEVAALGEWEELILTELVSGFRKLEQILRTYSPKRDAVLAAIQESLTAGRRVALVVKGQAFAEGLSWAVTFPPPYGLGLSREQCAAVTPDDVEQLGVEKQLGVEYDCVVHHAFDLHEVLAALSRREPRRITFVLLRNELRFVGERFLRLRGLIPNHVAHTTILSPIYRQVERLVPATAVVRRSRTSTLATDAKFQSLMRLFEGELSAMDYGTVLGDGGEENDGELRTEVLAALIRLEGDSAVFLEGAGRVTCICADDTIASKRGDCLEPGDRLIVISPEAREFIASRVLSARRNEERDTTADRTIRRWQQELSTGISRLGLSHAEVLQRIRELGSRRVTSGVIHQWAAGEVLGPLDPQDIRRVGEVVGSDWIKENWRSVGAALIAVRKGHRVLGRRITQIIQKAAIGEHEISAKDRDFLSQIGITMGRLQDAVTVLTVEQVTSEAGMVPVDRIGRVIPA
jgi:hypothetical protein